MNIGFFQGQGIGSLMTMLSVLFSKARPDQGGKAYQIPDRIFDMTRESYLRTERIIRSFSIAQGVFQEKKPYTQKLTVKKFINVLQSHIKELTEALLKKELRIRLGKLPEGASAKMILFEENKMKIVFKELLVNAIKYSQRGDEITIIFALKKKNFSIRILNRAYENEDGSFGIEGINEKLIFEPFFRLVSTMDDRFIDIEDFSFGMGLAIVRKILQLNKASIFVNNVNNFIPQRNKDICTRIELSLV
jgi:signal transduction histidine kinase